MFPLVGMYEPPLGDYVTKYPFVNGRLMDKVQFSVVLFPSFIII